MKCNFEPWNWNLCFAKWEHIEGNGARRAKKWHKLRMNFHIFAPCPPPPCRMHLYISFELFLWCVLNNTQVIVVMWWYHAQISIQNQLCITFYINIFIVQVLLICFKHCDHRWRFVHVWECQITSRMYSEVSNLMIWIFCESKQKQKECLLPPTFGMKKRKGKSPARLLIKSTEWFVFYKKETRNPLPCTDWQIPTINLGKGQWIEPKSTIPVARNHQ